MAYKLWLESQTDDFTWLANLIRKQDRVAAGSYIVTGELLGGTTGSVVMFANPVGSGALSMNQNFLQTIEIGCLMNEWQKPKVSDIIQAALNLVTARISIYSSLAHEGKLQIKVFNRTVDLENP